VPPPQDAPGPRLLALWRRLAPRPGGRTLFSLLIGRMVPYSGTIGARVTHLEPGHARLVIRDRRRVRNHLDSVHAVALANAGELASGLAMLTGLPATVRGIVTHMGITFSKKARGPLTAEAWVSIPDVHGPVEHVVVAKVRDESGDVVATVEVRWRLDPARPV